MTDSRRGGKVVPRRRVEDKRIEVHPGEAFLRLRERKRKARYEEEPQITQITGITQMEERFLGAFFCLLLSSPPPPPPPPSSSFLSV